MGVRVGDDLQKVGVQGYEGWQNLTILGLQWARAELKLDLEKRSTIAWAPLSGSSKGLTTSTLPNTDLYMWDINCTH